jgi:hypothetical protein
MPWLLGRWAKPNSGVAMLLSGVVRTSSVGVAVESLEAPRGAQLEKRMAAITSVIPTSESFRIIHLEQIFVRADPIE